MAWKIIDSAFVKQIKFKIHKSSFGLYIFYVLEEAIKLYCSVKQDIQNGDRVHLTFCFWVFKNKENVRQQE